MKQSFYRISGLKEAIQKQVRPGELQDLISYLGEWFTLENFDRLHLGAAMHNRDEIQGFLDTLRTVADDYARADVNVEFLRVQLIMRDRNDSEDKT